MFRIRKNMKNRNLLVFINAAYRLRHFYGTSFISQCHMLWQCQRHDKMFPWNTISKLRAQNSNNYFILIARYMYMYLYTSFLNLTTCPCIQEWNIGRYELHLLWSIYLIHNLVPTVSHLTAPDLIHRWPQAEIINYLLTKGIYRKISIWDLVISIRQGQGLRFSHKNYMFEVNTSNYGFLLWFEGLHLL